MSGGRVRLLRNGEGLPKFASCCVPRVHSSEAVGKIPHLPSTAPWEIHRRQQTWFADKRFHDRRIACGAACLRNARNCPLTNKSGLPAAESESTRPQHSNPP